MMKTVLVVGALAATTAFAMAQASRTHDLTLLPQNVHWGYYDASVKPVLRVASCDTVRVETMIASGLQRLRAATVTLEPGRCAGVFVSSGGAASASVRYISSTLGASLAGQNCNVDVLQEGAGRIGLDADKRPSVRVVA